MPKVDKYTQQVKESKVNLSLPIDQCNFPYGHKYEEYFTQWATWNEENIYTETPRSLE